MLALEITARAQSDLRAILSYSRTTWGPRQAAEYLRDFDDLFGLLVSCPGIGRVYPTARHQHRQRIEHGSHVVLYTHNLRAVTIHRVMHKRQLLQRAAR